MRNRNTKLAALILVLSSAFIFSALTSKASGPVVENEPQRGSQTRNRRGAEARKQTAILKYSKFSHDLPQHRRACDSCHKFPSKNWKEARKGSDAFPDITDYPEHAACIDCHRQQFFRGAQPIICTICHTDPGPRNSARYPFPSLGEAFLASKKGQSELPEFGVFFPHDKHIEIIGQNLDDSTTRQGFRVVLASFSQKKESKEEESDPKSCAVCHKTYQPQGESDEEFVTKPPKDLPETAFWLKRGTFKTSPMTHAACFTCHSQDSGLSPAPNDCAVCHKLLPSGEQIRIAEPRGDYAPALAAQMGITDIATLMKWSRRDTAKYRHEWLPHAGLKCTACHNVMAMNTLDEKTKKVPVKSCGGEGSGCHIESSNDGILNLEVAHKKARTSFECAKCHVQNGKRPAPDSHISAITTK